MGNGLASVRLLVLRFLSYQREPGLCLGHKTWAYRYCEAEAMSEPRETYRNPEPCKRHGINSCLGCDNQIPVPTHGTEPEGEEPKQRFQCNNCGGDLGSSHLHAIMEPHICGIPNLTPAPTEPKPGGEEEGNWHLRRASHLIGAIKANNRDDMFIADRATEALNDIATASNQNTKLQSALDGFEAWMVEWLHPSHPGPDMGELLAIYHGEITENYRPGFDSWIKTRIANRIQNALEAK